MIHLLGTIKDGQMTAVCGQPMGFYAKGEPCPQCAELIALNQDMMTDSPFWANLGLHWVEVVSQA